MMTLQPTVLVTDQINQRAIDILAPHCHVINKPKLTHDELLALVPTVDALLVRSASTVSADVFKAAPNLQIVGRAGVGVDNIDLTAANEHGVIVVNSPEGNTVAAAEHTVGLLFALSRHIARGDASLKQGQWDRKALTGIELYNKTLGLIGLGKIGSRVASIAKATGMKVLVYDPFVSPSVVEEMGATLVTLPQLFEKSDYITVHVPKTKETANLLNKETLKQCKKGVRLINCARGGIINEQDLAEALRSGHVAGAALDVFEVEPLPLDHPLLADDLRDKLLITPHLGASTEEAQINVALDVAEQVVDYFQQGTVRAAVNLPIMRAAVLDPVKPFMPLAEVLGKLARQVLGGVIQRVELVVKGDLAEKNIAPLSLAVLKGLLSVNREGVTFVNAQHLAKVQGIDVQESKSNAKGTFSDLITVVVENQQGQRTHLSGVMMATDVMRIVDIDGFKTSLKPTAHVLLCPHEDKPGMVAKIGAVLGDNAINIAALQVGKHSDGNSLMIFNLDSPVNEAVLQQIEALEGFTNPVAIAL